MIKVVKATKDTYITNRVVNNQRMTGSNVGAAGSLDLFKLYGYTSTLSGSTAVPNTELSRLLVWFDVTPIRTLLNSGRVDPTNQSFNCKLVLHDVYGGQPTPDNFSVVINPLSASFDEGRGRDVVFYSDGDSCNWVTASGPSTAWYVTGCGLGGHDAVLCDFLTASRGTLLTFSQSFTTGEEDLYVDVTAAISATLAGAVPSAGFRIALSQSYENDQRSYFVKRFASRTAYNTDLKPKLLVRYDDSIQDDVNNLYLDSRGYLFLRNYSNSAPANIASSSVSITGSNCLLLQLITAVSGGTYSLHFTGSQHYSGINPQTGIYSASVLISSTDSTLRPQWLASGSITFTPIWKSLDGSVAYVTGSAITVYVPQRGSQALEPRKLIVSVTGLRDRHRSDETTTLRVNIFDYSSPRLLLASRVPSELPGVIIRDVHYQVRDLTTDRIVVPYDTSTNSTRISNDSAGMHFKLDFSNLTENRTYVIDIMTVSGDNVQNFESASPPFKVVAAG